MTPWKAKPVNVYLSRKPEVKIAVTDSDAMNARILKLVTDLGNTVLAKKAANDLQMSVPMRKTKAAVVLTWID